MAPLSWGQVLSSKALACFLTCCFVSVVLLLFGALVFKVRVERPVQLFMAIVCTSFCFVGILMFLCTLGKTVEGVSGMAWGILLGIGVVGFAAGVKKLSWGEG